MKKIILIVLISLINSCIPYKSYIKKDTECDFDMTIREDEKTLKILQSDKFPIYREDDKYIVSVKNYLEQWQEYLVI